MNDLITKNIIFNYPPDLRPIKQEFIYFTAKFAKKVRWVDKRGYDYYLKDENNKLELTTDKDNPQDMFYDQVMSDLNSRFMIRIMKNKDNEQGSKMIEAYQFFDPIKIESRSLPYTSFTFQARIFSDDVNEIGFYTAGTLKQFQSLNYNELPSELWEEKIYVSRVLLDYHFLRKDETDLMDYSSRADHTLKELKEDDKVFCYLDYYNYTLHIGRYKRFVENAYLMFLKIKNESNGEFYTPYRVISLNNYKQRENLFFFIPKNKIKSYFNLKSYDEDYKAIFDKVENEKQDADGVWMSDVLLSINYQFKKF